MSEVKLRKFMMMIEDIPITVERKMIRTIRLSIAPPDAAVHLSAPAILTDKQIRDYLVSKLDWIRTHSQVLKNRPHRPVREYQTGDGIAYLGELYPLELHIHERPPKVDFDDGKIHLYVRSHYTREMREAVVREWYRAQLYHLLPSVIEKWEKILGVKATSFQVRPMKTQWGSCAIPSYRLHFSTSLAVKSPRCIEYVVAHELTHIIVHNHSARFYQILDSHFEDAEDLKADMKRPV